MVHTAPPRNAIPKFDFGCIVAPNWLVGRERELKLLCARLTDGHDTHLVGPRGFGKSSLLRGVAHRRTATQHICAEVNVAGCYSARHLCECLAQALGAAAETVVGDQSIAASLRALSLQLTDTVDASELIRRVLNGANELARYHEIRFDILLDEAPEVERQFGRAAWETLLDMAAAQTHVTYIFSSVGSLPMVMDAYPRTPLSHLSGDVLYLGEIAGEAWQYFLRLPFTETGRPLLVRAVERLLVLAHHVPYNVQRLAAELHRSAKQENGGALGVEDVDAALARIVDSESRVYQLMFECRTPHVKKVLRALAGLPERSGSNLGSAYRYRIIMGAAPTPPQLAQRDVDAQIGSLAELTKMTFEELVAMLTSLVKDDTLRVTEPRKDYPNFAFVDPFFAHWISRSSA